MVTIRKARTSFPMRSKPEAGFLGGDGTVGSRKLEYGSGTIKAGVPSSLGLGVGGTVIYPNFMAAAVQGIYRMTLHLKMLRNCRDPKRNCYVAASEGGFCRIFYLHSFQSAVWAFSDVTFRKNTHRNSHVLQAFGIQVTGPQTL